MIFWYCSSLPSNNVKTQSLCSFNHSLGAIKMTRTFLWYIVINTRALVTVDDSLTHYPELLNALLSPDCGVGFLVIGEGDCSDYYTDSLFPDQRWKCLSKIPYSLIVNELFYIFRKIVPCCSCYETSILFSDIVQLVFILYI